MYPEFIKHRGTIIMFPSRGDIWRENAYHMQKYIIDLVNIISKFEHVYLFCEPKNYNKVSFLANQYITVIQAEYDDIWARDISPTFIYSYGKTKCIDWKFNAWGGKKQAAYFPWENDNAFATVVSSYFGYENIKIPLVCEGGAILSDGNGTLFTTKSVLCNSNRNPFKTKESIELVLKNSLNINRVIWLNQGLVNDETNGHIDNILTIVRPGEICLSWTDDTANPNYKRVREIFDVIQKEYNGKIYKIPLPELQYLTDEEAKGLDSNDNSINRVQGMVLPASYVNIHFVNGGVIIPAFGSPWDQVVYDLYKEIFFDREIIQVYSREPLIGGGGIHCLLRDIPMEI